MTKTLLGLLMTATSVAPIASTATQTFYCSPFELTITDGIAEKLVESRTFSHTIVSTRNDPMVDMYFDYDVFLMSHNSMYQVDRPLFYVPYMLKVKLYTDVKYANGLGGWFTEEGNACLEQVSVRFDFKNWTGVVNQLISYPLSPNNYSPVNAYNPSLNSDYISSLNLRNTSVDEYSGRYQPLFIPYADDIEANSHNLKLLNQPKTDVAFAAIKNPNTPGSQFSARYSHASYPVNGETITYYGLFDIVPEKDMTYLDISLEVHVYSTIAKDTFWGDCKEHGYINDSITLTF